MPQRGDVIAKVEAAATDRLIKATDAALGRLWQNYSTAELHELAQALPSGAAVPIVQRFDDDLRTVFGDAKR